MRRRQEPPRLDERGATDRDFPAAATHVDERHPRVFPDRDVLPANDPRSRGGRDRPTVLCGHQEMSWRDCSSVWSCVLRGYHVVLIRVQKKMLEIENVFWKYMWLRNSWL